jgi:hypothetical protein
MSHLTSVGIVPRGFFDFSELRNGTVRVPIAQWVDVAGASSLALEVRVFDATIAGKASVTLRVAADSSSPETDGPSILQTKTAKGEDIATFVIDSKAVMPLYQIVKIPADEVGLCLAVILEARGAESAGPKLSLSIDVLIRESGDAREGGADFIEPVIARPDHDDSSSGTADAKIAAAARLAMAARTSALPRYPRWREVVV